MSRLPSQSACVLVTRFDGLSLREAAAELDRQNQDDLQFGGRDLDIDEITDAARRTDPGSPEGQELLKWIRWQLWYWDE